jgi:UDP-3-O-[3-hydroxymyristoyl] N-acetylglucosamine deacetylase
MKMTFQQTLKLPIKFCGIGVHSGILVNVTLKPAPENTGIVFKRVDKHENNLIEARYDRVVDTRLCTVIENDHGLKVSTIEHLMSAFWGVGIDNAIVEIDGEEMAIMDGSSAPFVAMIEKAGLSSQNAARKYIKIRKEITIKNDDKFVQLLPADSTSFKCSIEFPHPCIGYQEALYDAITSDYGHEISRARTFGFTKEIEMLKSMGLARGGSLDNAIGLDETSILNPEGLRYKNEFASHKLLDLIGDLYLAGYRIIGKIETHRSGHHLNNMTLRQLFANPDSFRIMEFCTSQKASISA